MGLSRCIRHTSLTWRCDAVATAATLGGYSDEYNLPSEREASVGGLPDATSQQDHSGRLQRQDRTDERSR